MQQELTSTRERLTTPRAAAVAGILFSVLLIISLVLIRISVPADPHAAGAWLSSNGNTVRLALNLLPFSGVAFLWFISVVRHSPASARTGCSPRNFSAVGSCFWP